MIIILLHIHHFLFIFKNSSLHSTYFKIVNINSIFLGALFILFQEKYKIYDEIKFDVN